MRETKPSARESRSVPDPTDCTSLRPMIPPRPFFLPLARWIQQGGNLSFLKSLSDAQHPPPHPHVSFFSLRFLHAAHCLCLCFRAHARWRRGADGDRWRRRTSREPEPPVLRISPSHLAESVRGPVRGIVTIARWSCEGSIGINVHRHHHRRQCVVTKIDNDEAGEGERGWQELTGQYSSNTLLYLLYEQVKNCAFHDSKGYKSRVEEKKTSLKSESYHVNTFLRGEWMARSTWWLINEFTWIEIETWDNQIARDVCAMTKVA